MYVDSRCSVIQDSINFSSLVSFFLTIYNGCSPFGPKNTEKSAGKFVGLVLDFWIGHNFYKVSYTFCDKVLNCQLARMNALMARDLMVVALRAPIYVIVALRAPTYMNIALRAQCCALHSA